MISIRTLPRWIPGPWRAFRWGDGSFAFLRAVQLSESIATLRPLTEVQGRTAGPALLLALIAQASRVVENPQAVVPLFGSRVTITHEQRGRHLVQWTSDSAHQHHPNSSQAFWLRIHYRKMPPTPVLAALTAAIQLAVNGALSTPDEIAAAQTLAAEAHHQLPSPEDP